MRLALCGCVPLTESDRKLRGYSPTSEGCVRGYAKGFAQNGVTVNVISATPSASYPRDKRVFFPGGPIAMGAQVKGEAIPYLNISGVKQIALFVGTFFFLLRWGIRHRREKDKAVMTFVSFSAPMIAVYLAARLCRMPYLVLLMDPVLFVTKAHPLKKILVSIDNTFVRWTVRHANGVYNLTKDLAQTYAPGRPACLMRCGMDPEELRPGSQQETKGKRVIVYSGAFDSRYLISLMLEACAQLNPELYELHVYGRGELDHLLDEAAGKYPHIKRMPFVPRQELLDAQRQASLLLSLKDPLHPFVPYCFSSRLLEYLASGTPVLMTHTHEADAFGDLVEVAHDLTPEAVARDIVRLCGMSEQERALRLPRLRAALERFTWQENGREMTAFLRTIVDKPC